MSGGLAPDDQASAPSVSRTALASSADPVAGAPLGWLLDPRLSPGATALSRRQEAPAGSGFRLAMARPSAEPPMPPAAPDRTQPLPLAFKPAQLAQSTPLPTPLPAPRPAELQAPAALRDAVPAEPPRIAQRQGSRRSRIAALQAPPEDNRNFIEKLFGFEPSPAPKLAYAALQTGPLQTAPERLSPPPGPGGGTAIYDISARTVTLPNGEVLEAHSGLGASLDDPRSAHVRMRGATPPATYELTEREQLFHGVRALRLNPVGGSAAIHGRDGLLAHTFMLGPNGDSNGCVSFRDYNRFLQAYLSGQVQRLVVVPGRGDSGPSLAKRLFGTGRTARRDRDA